MQSIIKPVIAVVAGICFGMTTVQAETPGHLQIREKYLILLSDGGANS